MKRRVRHRIAQLAALLTPDAEMLARRLKVHLVQHPDRWELRSHDRKRWLGNYHFDAAGVEVRNARIGTTDNPLAAIASIAEIEAHRVERASVNR